MENFDNKENFLLFIFENEENIKLFFNGLRLYQKVYSKDTLRSLKKIKNPTTRRGNFLEGMKFLNEFERDEKELKRIRAILKRRYKAWYDVKCFQSNNNFFILK